MSKSIQQILDEQRAIAPIFTKTDRSIAVSSNNVLTKTGTKMPGPVWNKGKTGVQEAWNKGIPATEEARRKMSESQKKSIKTPHSEETKKKMSESAKARGPRPVSMRLKLSATKSKPIMTPAGRFETRALAAAHYGITPTGMGARMHRYPDQYYYIENGKTNG